MSLAQHVSSNEGDDRETFGGELSLVPSGAPIGRRLSFDPLPHTQLFIEHVEETTGAYEVSSSKRIGTVLWWTYMGSWY